MYEISITYCYNEFCTKQYDLNDCVVKESNTKSFAKTSKGDKKGDRIILSRVEEKYSGVQDWRAVCFFALV